MVGRRARGTVVSKKAFVPEGWEFSTLGDSAEIEMGQSPPGTATNDKGAGTPLIGGASEFHNGDLIPTRYTTSPTKLCERGDLILCIRATIGKTAVADREYCLGRGVAGIRVSSLEPNWIVYFLKASQDLLSSMGTGTTFKQIDKKKLSALKVPIPPLNEQKRIIHKIEELQSHSRRAKEALETIPDLLEQLRQSILAAAFRGDLTKKWREKHKDKIEPATELLKSIRTERRKRWEEAELEKLKAKGLTGDKLEAQFAKRRKQYKEPVPVDAPDLPELTEGWCWTNIDTILKLPESLSYGILKPGIPEVDGVPMLRVLDIGDGMINDTEIMRVSPALAKEYKRTMLKHGDIVLAVMATIGRAAVIPKEFAGANVNRALAVLKVSSLIEPYYLLFVLLSPFMAETFRSKTIGSAQPRINLSDLRKMTIPLAPRKEQQIIVNQVKQYREKCRTATVAYERLTSDLNHLNQTMLSHAFRGKLVSQDPKDEPASILLEHIHEEVAQRKPERKARTRTINKKRHLMKKMDKTSVLEFIEAMPQESFAFDELRAKLPSDYDALKDILFALLDDSQSGLIQVFDKQAKEMRFRLRAKK